MTSTFRLTRAEFKKIFKRPSIFIMALLIVATIFASLFMFNPEDKSTNNITYDNASTSQGYYDIFYNQDQDTSKKGIDLEYSQVDNIISYYNNYYIRNIGLEDYYSTFIKKLDDVRNESNATLKNEKYTSLKTALKQFYDAYLNFDSLSSQDFVDYTKNNTYFQNSCTYLKKLIANSETLSASEFVTTYDQPDNKYEENIKKELETSKNFISSTLTFMAQEIKDNFSAYSTDVDNGSQKLLAIEQDRKKLQTSLNNYKEYLEKLVDNEFPIVVVNKENLLDIKNLLDNAISEINLSVTNQNSYPAQNSARDKLRNLNLVSNISTFTVSIEQVSVEKSLIDDLLQIQSKTNTNKTALLQTIENYRQDEAISNISFHISEYSLLAETYKEYVNDKIVVSITSNHSKPIYTAYYNYDFENFNLYQYNERLTQNEYYITNNIYENSFLSNFSYNQKSGNDTNVYDFMYFSMEFCTVIIIIFAMMLMCNLITSETESGTIKLLLVRPYKRGKVITAKLMATLFFVLTFMLFSSVLTFVGGYFMFGYTSQNVLAVFNASTAFVIHPLLLMLINIISLTIDVSFYVFLALMISIIFKNYAGSISCALVLIIINYALNGLFGGVLNISLNSSFWYTILPSMNLHLFKYFGNTFLNSSANALQSILITSIENSMSILYSVLITIGYSVVFLLIAYNVFKKRDF